MTERPGRTTPLTVLTPIRPGRTPRLRATFDVLPRTPRGASDQLRQLSFIQSARWSILTGLPCNGPQHPRERLKYDYLLFESNFNGRLDAYIEAFAEVLGDRMTRVWGSSFGFPGAVPIADFLTYIHRNDLDADHFYSAYPDASATEVMAALRILRLIRPLRASARRLDAAGFRRSYDEALTAAQHDPTAPLPRARYASGDAHGSAHAFTALTPIRDGHLPVVRDYLRGLGRHCKSPLESVGGIHFARWVVVPDVTYQGPPQRRDSLRSAYLLFTTTSNSRLDTHLEALRVGLGEVADAVWGHCAGYPGQADPRAFAAYLRHNRIPTRRLVSGSPDATVAQVRAALKCHGTLLDFALRHQDATPEELQHAFVTTFDGAP